MADINQVTQVPIFTAPLPAEGHQHGVDYELQSAAQRPDPPGEEEQGHRSRARILGIMAALLLSLFIASLNYTIVTTAIPTISAYFHSASGYTWIGSSISLATAASEPLWGKLSDIWGRKPMLLVATAIFAIASLLCATSVNMSMLIAGRSLQGIGIAGLMVLVNICISDLFSVRKRGLYYGLTEVVWALVGGIGPLLGGVFSEYVSWRWCWYIFLPLAAIAFVLTVVFLDVHNPRTPMREGLKAIDWLGSLTIVGFTLMVLMGLDFGGSQFPWDSPKVICLIVFGALMSVVFVFTELKVAKYPVMPLHSMRSRANIAIMVICFSHGFCFIGVDYYLPLYLQSVKQQSPLMSGVLLLPISVMEAVTGSICGLFIHKTGRYLEIIYAGGIIQTIGIGLFIHFGSSTSIAEIVIFQMIAGVGAGLLFTPPLIALQAVTSQSETATATATFGFMRNLATCVSIVAGSVVFQNSMTTRAHYLSAAGIESSVLQLFSGQEAAANVNAIGSLQGVQKQAAKDAYAWSMKNVYIMYCVVSAVSVVASCFIARQELQTHHTETKTGLKEKETGASTVPQQATI